MVEEVTMICAVCGRPVNVDIVPVHAEPADDDREHAVLPIQAE